MLRAAVLAAAVSTAVALNLNVLGDAAIKALQMPSKAADFSRGMAATVQGLHQSYARLHEMEGYVNATISEAKDPHTRAAARLVVAKFKNFISMPMGTLLFEPVDDPLPKAVNLSMLVVNMTNDHAYAGLRDGWLRFAITGGANKTLQISIHGLTPLHFGDVPAVQLDIEATAPKVLLERVNNAQLVADLKHLGQGHLSAHAFNPTRVMMKMQQQPRQDQGIADLRPDQSHHTQLVQVAVQQAAPVAPAVDKLAWEQKGMGLNYGDARSDAGVFHFLTFLFSLVLIAARIQSGDIVACLRRVFITGLTYEIMGLILLLVATGEITAQGWMCENMELVGTSLAVTGCVVLVNVILLHHMEAADRREREAIYSASTRPPAGIDALGTVKWNAPPTGSIVMATYHEHCSWVQQEKTDDCVACQTAGCFWAAPENNNNQKNKKDALNDYDDDVAAAAAPSAPQGSCYPYNWTEEILDSPGYGWKLDGAETRPPPCRPKPTELDTQEEDGPAPPFTWKKRDDHPWVATDLVLAEAYASAKRTDGADKNKGPGTPLEFTQIGSWFDTANDEQMKNCPYTADWDHIDGMARGLTACPPGADAAYYGGAPIIDADGTVLQKGEALRLKFKITDAIPPTTLDETVRGHGHGATHALMLTATNSAAMAEVAASALPALRRRNPAGVGAAAARVLLALTATRVTFGNLRTEQLLHMAYDMEQCTAAKLIPEFLDEEKQKEHLMFFLRDPDSGRVGVIKWKTSTDEMIWSAPRGPTRWLKDGAAAVHEAVRIMINEKAGRGQHADRCWHPQSVETYGAAHCEKKPDDCTELDCATAEKMCLEEVSAPLSRSYVQNCPDQSSWPQGTTYTKPDIIHLLAGHKIIRSPSETAVFGAQALCGLLEKMRAMAGCDPAATLEERKACFEADRPETLPPLWFVSRVYNFAATQYPLDDTAGLLGGSGSRSTTKRETKTLLGNNKAVHAMQQQADAVGTDAIGAVAAEMLSAAFKAVNEITTDINTRNELYYALPVTALAEGVHKARQVGKMGRGKAGKRAMKQKAAALVIDVATSVLRQSDVAKRIPKPPEVVVEVGKENVKGVQLPQF